MPRVPYGAGLKTNRPEPYFGRAKGIFKKVKNVIRMNQNGFIKFLVLGIVIILAVIGVYFVTTQIKDSEQLDPTIKAAADSYVISLVGNSEFQKNYEFDYEKSEKWRDTDQIGGSYIRYKFLPAEKYGGSEFLFFYTFTDNQVKIANNDVPLTLPSCEKDKNECDFKLSLEELGEIARRENLSDQYFALVMYNGEIVAEVSYCNLETGENRRKIYVDLQDGTIVWDGPNSECQGII